MHLRQLHVPTDQLREPQPPLSRSLRQRLTSRERGVHVDGWATVDDARVDAASAAYLVLVDGWEDDPPAKFAGALGEVRARQIGYTELACGHSRGDRLDHVLDGTGPVVRERVPVGLPEGGDLLSDCVDLAVIRLREAVERVQVRHRYFSSSVADCVSGSLSATGTAPVNRIPSRPTTSDADSGATPARIAVPRASNLSFRSAGSPRTRGRGLVCQLRLRALRRHCALGRPQRISR